MRPARHICSRPGPPAAAILLLTLICSPADITRAQERDAADDSLLTYELSEIVVRGSARGETTVQRIQRVPLASLTRARAASADEVMRLVPSAYVQTNSRGESIVYLRNANDRQLNVLLDGAPLNIPWDNRFDFSLIPAGVLDEIDVAKGASSAVDDPGAIGGTISMRTRRLAVPGRLTEFELGGGSVDLRHARATQLYRSSSTAYTASLGYNARDGLPLPSGHGLSFEQSDDAIRTNTDRRLLDVFARGEHWTSDGRQIAVTLIHSATEQGVAPEGHLDPQQSRVRYWRYPTRTVSTAILAGTLPLGASASVLGTAWLGRFHQIIDAYAEGDYRSKVESEDQQDLSAGARLSSLMALRGGTLRLALTARTSRHLQETTDYLTADPDPTTPVLRFRQHDWSAYAEYEKKSAEGLRVMVGAGLEGIATPGTGDKPARSPEMAVSLTSGLTYALSPNSLVRLLAARRTRFPTMRELFGEALGRFLVNPDLTAESAIVIEGGVETRNEAISVESVLFYERQFDTIDQRSVVVAGEDRPRRQRVNLEGGRTAGVEATLQARIARQLSLSSHLLWAPARTFEGGDTRPRIEKPEWLGTASLLYRITSRLSLLTETVYTGTAWGLLEDNHLQSLPSSLTFNVRLGYRLAVRGMALEFYGRADNLTDELTLPQLGLPGPGRMFRFGVDVSIPSS